MQTQDSGTKKPGDLRLGPPHLQRCPERAHHTQEEAARVHQRNSPVPLHPSSKISCAATEPAARAPFRSPPPLGVPPLGYKNSTERRFSRTSARPSARRCLRSFSLSAQLSHTPRPPACAL
ncbi:hypothetical protein Q8A67_022062 [Cirrhinus molitorella]|uniref:Uncharacterized protein n=1 Tax=Cirrhinus molitorella TaxID=172907 RepID=A0AA88PB38_9TELE|nr:hypothetical protein Q8A67_022062 [Cirrhinus molitorella]